MLSPNLRCMVGMVMSPEANPGQGDASVYRYALLDSNGRVREGNYIDLPRVTTIMDEAIPKGGALTGWAYNTGLDAALTVLAEDPEGLIEDIDALKKAAKDRGLSIWARGKSGKDRGSTGHNFFEKLMSGVDVELRDNKNWYYLPEDHKLSTAEDPYLKGGVYDDYCRGIHDWWKSVFSEGIETLYTEKPLYSLKHRYAGTLDLLAARGQEKRLVLTDLKTSGNKTCAERVIYLENRVQLAAYSVAVQEMFGLTPAAYSILVVDFNGDFAETFVEPEFEVWFKVLELWRALHAEGS